MIIFFLEAQRKLIIMTTSKFQERKKVFFVCKILTITWDKIACIIEFVFQQTSKGEQSK
jgi:hypothetical protein